MSDHDDNDPQSRRPSSSAFKQQNLPAWQPILTPAAVIVTFILIGVIFIPVGIVLFLASSGVSEFSFEYSALEDTNNCEPILVENNVTGAFQYQSRFASTEITLPDDFNPNGETVYVYYELTNYYQNHRRYVKSRSDAQLRGDEFSEDDFGELDVCDPRAFANQSTEFEVDDPPMSDWYNPCGLIAWSMFNDTFALMTGNNSMVEWTDEGIAWASDKDKKFGTRDDYGIPLTQGPNNTEVSFQDENFIVWMRTAGLPHFRKLYRIIDEPGLSGGTYTLNINCNFPVASFEGTKTIVFSTTSWIGGKNNFLGMTYIVVGGICLLLGLIFLVINIVKPRKLGDQDFLAWSSQ